MCETMKHLNIAIDGGKDSLSMAAKVKITKGNHEIVKSPGTLVVSAYAPVPDIRIKVTPELTVTNTQLLYVNLSGQNQFRSGGTALAQVFNNVGDHVPDLDDPEHLKQCFYIVQKLIKEKICTAGHDVSDGGIITCLLEMAFASNCGIEANFTNSSANNIQFLFSEECGVIIQVIQSQLTKVENQFNKVGIHYQVIGKAVPNDIVKISVNNSLILEASN